MPYISGDVNEALDFANENRLLLCICGDDGDPLEADHIQQAMKQHHGIMLLVGKQPQVRIFTHTHTIKNRNLSTLPSRST